MTTDSNHKVDYVEIPSRDLPATKAFFTELFGLKFTDFGPEYMDFFDGRIHGGFFKSEKVSSTDNGSSLVVFYADDLESTCERVKSLGGKIIKEIFTFPGGRRFQFTDPGGSEFAVWSDK
jgi:predicted enzyme related to lactoylglutathione lyase